MTTLREKSELKELSIRRSRHIHRALKEALDSDKIRRDLFHRVVHAIVQGAALRAAFERATVIAPVYLRFPGLDSNEAQVGAGDARCAPGKPERSGARARYRSVDAQKNSRPRWIGFMLRSVLRGIDSKELRRNQPLCS